jgi:serine/threonine-protein kinase
MTTFAAADCNLLFGILALQMDFINRDALIAAMHTWVLDKAKSLGQILEANGQLSPGRRAALDALVREHLAAHGDEPRRSLAAAAARTLLPEELGRLADADLQASLDSVVSRQTAELAPTVDAHPPSHGGSGQRFRVLRPHAKGGLGEVFVALDQELHREVALKEMRSRYAEDPSGRARFVLEAEVTGQLEHPGIVPVYGFGYHADGRPYYAMRLVKGHSLGEALARFHQAEGPGRDPGERALALRQLLGRFVAVCNAVAYAHSRGVLHRDLKPENIMLGKYGETLIVDWGLAKPLTSAAAGDAASEVPLLPALSGGSAPTLMGSVVGTPAFMSPEQAAGQMDQLGPASDVYGLGATLYMLLTGQPPVAGRDASEVLGRVQRGEVVPPRQVKATTPPVVAAICQKAMALEPAARYPTVLALAADVERWLADEPVGAWPEPRTVRVARWVRRHKTGVTAAVAAALVAALCLGTSTGLLLAAYREVGRQRDLARTQRDRARARFQLARGAVDQFHTQVSESPELKAHGLELLRQKLLEAAVAFYRHFVQEEDDDPAVRAEHGRGYRRLADLVHGLGRHEQADAAYTQARAIFEQIGDAYPQEPDYQKELAQTLHSQGAFYRDLNRNELAEQLFLRALEIRQRLMATYPEDASSQQGLGRTYHNLALLYSETGRNEEAEQANEQARTIFQRLVDAHPDVADYERALALSLNNMGVIYHATGRMTQAEKLWLRARELRGALVAAHPQVPEFQQDLGRSHHNLGNLYNETDRNGLAEAAFRDAVVIKQRLATEHLLVPEYEQDLAASYDDLGFVYSDTGRHEAAEQTHRQALQIRKKLAETYPDVPGYRHDTAKSHDNLAEAYYNLGHLDQAAKEWQDAGAINSRLAESYPKILAYATTLGGNLSSLGTVARDCGRFDEALRWYDQATQKLNIVLEREPHEATARAFLLSAHGGRALALSQLGRFSEARQALLQAGGYAPQPDAHELRYLRTLMAARLGDYANATAVADALAGEKSLAPPSLYELARVYSLAAEVSRHDSKLAPGERGRRPQHFAARAIELLHRIQAAGYFKSRPSLDRLKKEKDFDPIRSQEAFKRLLVELDKSATRA